MMRAYYSVCLEGLAAAPAQSSAIPAESQPEASARSTKSGRTVRVPARAAESAAQARAARDGSLFAPPAASGKPPLPSGVKRKRGRPTTSGNIAQQDGAAPLADELSSSAAAKVTEAAARGFLAQHFSKDKKTYAVTVLNVDESTQQRAADLHAEITAACRPDNGVTMPASLRAKMKVHDENLRLMIGALLLKLQV